MIELTYKELKQKSLNSNPANLVAELEFSEALKIARLMLINDEWDESLQIYATNILEEVKSKYPEQWDSSWK